MMSNPSKQKGTHGETSVVKFLREAGWEAERKALTGSKDCGDIRARRSPDSPWITIEVKCGKQTANPNRTQMEDWLKQARVEAINSNEYTSVLCILRYRRKIKDAEIYIQPAVEGKCIREQMYLDEFAFNF